MSVAEALSWGGALIAVGIAAAFTTSATVGIIDHLRGVRKLAAVSEIFNLEYLAYLEAIAGPSPVIREPLFHFVRQVALAETLRAAPLADEELLRRYAEPPDIAIRFAFRSVGDIRRLLGELPVRLLRQWNRYPEAVAYVANYDAGVRDARALLQRRGFDTYA